MSTLGVPLSAEFFCDVERGAGVSQKGLELFKISKSLNYVSLLLDDFVFLDSLGIKPLMD
jgi:hypothetical protein